MSSSNFLVLVIFVIAAMQALDIPQKIKRAVGDKFKYLEITYFLFLVFGLYWGTQGDLVASIIVTVGLIVVIVVLFKSNQSHRNH